MRQSDQQSAAPLLHSSSRTLSLKPTELSLAEASNFLGILERLPAGLAKETAPLGPAALLAGMHFLKKVAALGTWEPEPMTGPWEQLGQAVVSVASLVLEEQLAGAWLSVSEVRLAGLGGAGAWAPVPTLPPTVWPRASQHPSLSSISPSIRRSPSSVCFIS